MIFHGISVEYWWVAKNIEGNPGILAEYNPPNTLIFCSASNTLKKESLNE